MSTASDAASSLEKYLTGQPLNEELAALKEGKLPGLEVEPEAPEAAPASRIEDADRPLTDSERLDLREMRALPGWPILARIVERTCRHHDKNAMISAQDDPLRNRDKIAESFAYAQMYRRAAAEMMGVIDLELEELRRDKRCEPIGTTTASR